jgi:hypothetical protein
MENRDAPGVRRAATSADATSLDLTMMLWKSKLHHGIKAFREGNNEAAISLFTEVSFRRQSIEKAAAHYSIRPLSWEPKAMSPSILALQHTNAWENIPRLS